MSEPRALSAPDVVERARRAQAEFGLCDACLGRRFAKLETGLTNVERGRIVREGAGAREVAVGACWLCRGLLADVEAFAQAAVDAMAPYGHRHFLVGTRVDHEVEAREAELNEALDTKASAERIQGELNRETGKRVSALTGKPVEFKQPDITAVVDTRFLDAELQFGALYVFGRYRKFDRTIPQTRWPCNRCGGRKCVKCGMTGLQYASSVQELVARPFLESTGATGEAFHGAGREDIDARTLGEGRPFVLELKDPRVRDITLEGMPEEIARTSGGRVEVQDLRFTTKAEVAHVKEHGGQKTYVARVQFESPVSREALEAVVAKLRGAGIQQRTPQRVEHRRADLVRARRVHDLVVEEHEGARATLRVRGDAGLYIKELVSGDEGRTQPSLTGLLGVQGRVTELDIVGVEYEPPPAS